jgi:hypothetical protein
MIDEDDETNLAGDKDPGTSVRRTRSMLKRMRKVAKTGVRRSQLRRQRKRPITLPKITLCPENSSLT